MWTERRHPGFPLRVLLIILSMSWLQACEGDVEAVVNEVSTPVKLLKVPENYQVQSYSFVGRVEATMRSTLSFQVPGQIEQFHVRMGQKVLEGEVLAQLSSEDFQLAVDASQAEFDLSNVVLKRAKSLVAKRLISEDAYDQARTAFTSAQVSLKQAKTDLAYTSLYAPFSGVVSFTHAKNYQNVGASQPVLNLQGTERFDVSFSLPISMSETVRFQQGSRAELSVSLDAFVGVVLPAQFKEISTQPDPETNSYVVTITVDRPSQLNILTGMSGVVKAVDLDALQNGFSLPASALLNQEQDQAQIWRLDPLTQRLEAVTIQIGDEGEVLSGLEPGDQVVSAGVNDLSAGQLVRRWEREAGI